MLALYKSPHSSEQLWKKTRIHKNTLNSRLKELEENKIIIKQRYGFWHRERFRSHDFYLLKWGNEIVRETIAFLFNSRIKSHDSIIPYTINSIGVSSHILTRDFKGYPEVPLSWSERLPWQINIRETMNDFLEKLVHWSTKKRNFENNQVVVWN
jgi:DNA-binding Lrp family transcriptional regulator